MKYAPYPKYKASGVEWLGDVPVGWEVKRLKFAATNTTSNVDKLTKDGEHDILLCNYTDVYKNDIISSELAFMQATATEKEIAQYSLDNECVIITKDSESWTDIAIPAYVEGGLKNVLCGYHLAIIKSGQTVGKHLYYVLASNLINQQFQIAANGVTRFGLPQSGINNAWLPVAPLPEQQTIAAFLDQQCGHIDSLIEKKRRMLDLLDEKRRALITQAVTRGLDPTVPMKDSGVEWLGMVPVGWEVKRLRFHSSINPPKSELRLVEESVVSFVPMESVGENGGLISQEKRLDEISSGYTYFAEWDVLIAKITPCFENGKGALATNLANGVGFGSTEFHVVRALNTMIPLFFFYISISQLFRKTGEAYMYGAGGQKRIPDTFIRDFLFPLPSLPEQQAIADYLDSQTVALDKQRKSIETSIELLREYRASLITHTVTGKIDVRNFSPAQ